VAREWLDRQLNGPAPVGLPWASVLAFLRLVTNSRVFEHPESMADAWGQVQAWLACETVWSPEPTERHADVLGEILKLPGMRGNLVPDAHLAALAIEHGLTLCSTDGDFARFRALRWLNPIGD
jgi:toxin-antitoxin system PIN domain toxin